MSKDPVEILNQRDAEVAQIRGYADLTEEAKQRRIDEVNARASQEYQQAIEDQERERAERLERSTREVFRVHIPATATDAEEAQIHAAYRAAFNDVYSSTHFVESPGEAQEELERLLSQAERSGDKLLARAAYHRAIDLGVQSVVDSYLSTRPQEEKAWESYTTAHEEARHASSAEGLLERGLAQRALSTVPEESDYPAAG